MDLLYKNMIKNSSGSVGSFVVQQDGIEEKLTLADAKIAGNNVHLFFKDEDGTHYQLDLTKGYSVADFRIGLDDQYINNWQMEIFENDKIN